MFLLPLELLFVLFDLYLSAFDFSALSVLVILTEAINVIKLPFVTLALDGNVLLVRLLIVRVLLSLDNAKYSMMRY